MVNREFAISERCYFSSLRPVANLAHLSPSGIRLCWAHGAGSPKGRWPLASQQGSALAQLRDRAKNGRSRAAL